MKRAVTKKEMPIEARIHAGGVGVQKGLGRYSVVSPSALNYQIQFFVSNVRLQWAIFQASVLEATLPGGNEISGKTTEAGALDWVKEPEPPVL